MMYASLLVALSATAFAQADPCESETIGRWRVERRVVRRCRVTEGTEERLAKAQQALDASPEEPSAKRAHDRLENRLVTRRARLVRLERKVHAQGQQGRQVRVFYGTTRTRWPRHKKWYGTRDAGRLSYGVAVVQIPDEHLVGEIEGSLKVIAVEEMTLHRWEHALSQAAAQSSGELLTYIHGFNNSFSYGARRAAQVAHDLEPDVVPVLFSWPANGGTFLAGAKYTFDENLAARSSLFLARFLDQLLLLETPNGPAAVSVFAHSLGSRVAADALLDANLAGGLPRSLHQLVFAAPDIDAWVFANRYLPVSVEAAERFTVYCARDDRALRLSRSVHGGYDRLGNCQDETLVGLHTAGVDVVDASKLYVDLLDHTKVSSSPRLLRDLGLVLAGLDVRAPERRLLDRGDRAELPP